LIAPTPHSPQLNIRKSDKPPARGMLRVRCIGRPQFGQAGRCLIWSPTGSPTGRINSLANMLLDLIVLRFFKQQIEIQTAV
jgi:hypothetical protein